MWAAQFGQLDVTYSETSSALAETWQYFLNWFSRFLASRLPKISYVPG